VIDIPALRSLEAISVHGSVSGAALSLGFTPSAVSQHVKKLERQTGHQLLERVGRGVLLTERGQRLVDSGRTLLQDLERLENLLHADAGSVQGELRVASFATAVRGLYAPVLHRVATEQPALTLTLVEQDPWDAVDAVATGRVDVAIVHNWTRVPLEIPAHVEAKALGDDVADALLPATHRLARRRSVTPADLAEEQWVATPVGTICHEWLLKMYDGTGRLPRVAHWANEFASHVALVEQGVAVALVPRLGRGPLPPSVVPVAVRDPQPRRLVQVLWRRTMSASPAVGYVAELLAQQMPTTEKVA
jgi:molybdate transport repressor ModE-like protein